MFGLRIGEERPTTKLICAGPLRLDMAERRATLDGHDLEISPLLMRLLQTLADRPHQLITRQQLKRELWPNSDQIDTERRLNTAMRALRAALKDEAEAPRYIETVRSHGYRWIGPGATHSRTRGWSRPNMVVAVALAVAVGVAAWKWESRVQPPPTTPMSLVRAQAALDQWRASPNATHRMAAERAVAAALRDASDSPAAYVLRAQAALEGHWDWKLAEQSYAKALELDSSNADARLGIAWLKVNRGDNEGALADANRLMLGSVLSGDRRTDLGWLLIRAGRPDLATAACPTSAGNVNGLSCAHTAFAALGQLEQARAAAVRLMRMHNIDPALVRRIEQMPAEAAYKQFLAWRAREFLPPNAFYFDRAQVLADAGFGTEAIDNLDRSVAAREPLAVKILSSPSFLSLRTNPRYQDLVRAVGAPVS